MIYGGSGWTAHAPWGRSLWYAKSLKNSQITVCPIWKPNTPATPPMTSTYGIFRSYYTQKFFSRPGSPTRRYLFLRKVPAPSVFIMMADSIRSASPTQSQYCEFTQGAITWGSDYGGVHFRHGPGRANMFFFDGHAETMKFSQYYSTVKTWITKYGFVKDSSSLLAVNKAGSLQTKGGL